MRFKDQTVWVRADEGGRPILDSSGRAEMKYRESDSKSYRPSASNLLPDDGTLPPPAAPRPARPSSSETPRRVPGLGGTSDKGPALEIWTDGACSGNPGPMGIGVVFIDGPQRREVGDYLGIGTNNIAELTAIERGLDLAAAAVDKDPARRVRIYSDSAYAIGLLEKNWKAKANQELVARLRRRLTAFPRVEFVKVAGHAGVPENERCDELARRAITRRSAVG